MGWEWGGSSCAACCVMRDACLGGARHTSQSLPVRVMRKNKKERERDNQQPTWPHRPKTRRRSTRTRRHMLALSDAVSSSHPPASTCVARQSLSSYPHPCQTWHAATYLPPCTTPRRDLYRSCDPHIPSHRRYIPPPPPPRPHTVPAMTA